MALSNMELGTMRLHAGQAPTFTTATKYTITTHTSHSCHTVCRNKWTFPLKFLKKIIRFPTDHDWLIETICMESKP